MEEKGAGTAPCVGAEARGVFSFGWGLVVRQGAGTKPGARMDLGIKLTCLVP